MRREWKVRTWQVRSAGNSSWKSRLRKGKAGVGRGLGRVIYVCSDGKPDWRSQGERLKMLEREREEAKVRLLGSSGIQQMEDLAPESKCHLLP